MSKLILYHGSQNIIEKPAFGKGKTYNDYGRGFYCTEHIELAKEWACTEGTDGYANKYEIETDGLSILNLSSDEYTILNWLAMRLGKLGEQFVLKSEKAFDVIRFVDYTVAASSEYYAKRKARDDEARAAYYKELEKEDIDGLFMRDIIREEIKPDDPRLR